MEVEEETLSCDLNEWAYADDGDYINEEMSVLESMYPTIKEILAKWNLFLNDVKTEFTRFYLAEINKKNNAGKSIRKLKEEEWRSTKSPRIYHVQYKGYPAHVQYKGYPAQMSAF